MPKNPKEKEEGSAEKDQKERGYYYDDAHGYEEYDPEEEDCDTETRGHGDSETDEEPGSRPSQLGNDTNLTWSVPRSS